MTDDEIDALVDRLKPDLRIAFRSVLSGDTIHAFHIGAHGMDGEHVDDALTLFLTNHFMGDVLMGINTSIEEATRKQIERMRIAMKIRQATSSGVVGNA